ncbi:MAG TPA: asparagine synthase (glutamine-hydrolyzing) [Gemmatimonadales bacterium]|nr:asparagine synthase (glutamine-hydrolyzing) [Gemmatimonadales bacterium]
MCGIAGIAALGDSPPPTPERLAAMTGTLVHRGPDEEGGVIEGGVALGMRRLAIIDVRCGHQPYYNEDRSVRAVFNGEIYNFRELRAELAARGHRFASGADGEVIAHLWEELGPAFPARLNGMFAIALHDRRRHRVLLVRDQLGIKPLYAAFTPGAVVFGSEIKALLASALVPRRLDLDAVGQFLGWEYVPAPRTLLVDVEKLRPAELVEIDLRTGAVRREEYWRPPLPDRGGSTLPRTPGEWEEAIDAKIGEAVRRQLVSDVPLGAFLSGGVDSSLVVASMGDARTFSIGFDDPTYDEVGWSRRVADHLGVRHEVQIIRPDVEPLFHRLMWHLDDPIGDFSIFPTYLVSRLARREVTVALSGDGGDEVFGGYETYLAQERARLWRRLPAFLRRRLVEPAIRRLRPRPVKKGLVNKAKRFIEGLEHDERLGHARWRLFLGERLREALFTTEARAALRSPLGAHVLELREEAGPRDEVDAGLYVDLRSYLSDNCLVKVDRMSMACSLEARVPLLDVELVELAFRMPSALKVHRGRTKVLLKRVAARHVPAECVHRPKQGFSIPIKSWLGGAFRPLVEELLAPARLAAEGVFEPPVVERLKREHLEGRANHSHVLWALLVFQDWRRRWSV